MARSNAPENLLKKILSGDKRFLVCVVKLAFLLFSSSATPEAISQTPSDLSTATGQQGAVKDRASLWEVGLAGVSIYGPDYPASEESHLKGIVLPYLVYRGDVLRLGDGSLARLVPVEASWIELDVSVDAAFAADSKDNNAREGMPDLDYLFEVGPQVTIHLIQKRPRIVGKNILDMNIQGRVVFSTDLSDLAHRGYVFSPELKYTRKNLLGAALRLRTSIAPIWATEQLMDYFYQVPQRFARAGRPAYDAGGGYLGTEIGLVLSWDVSDRVRLNLGTRFAEHRGARNEDSPLFTDQVTIAFRANFRWAAWKSQKTVARR